MEFIHVDGRKVCPIPLSSVSRAVLFLVLERAIRFMKQTFGVGHNDKISI
jgi:hypothetical protein